MNRRNLLGRTLAFTLASPMAAMAQQAPLRILGQGPVARNQQVGECAVFVAANAAPQLVEF